MRTCRWVVLLLWLWPGLVKGLAVGMGQPGSRYLLSGEARWRFTGGKRHAMGQGGTLLFPPSDGALRSGAFMSLGLGVDHAR